MYLLRSKSSLFHMRDFKAGEMKEVGPRAWVSFESLPRGMSPEGDGEVSVKLIECDEDMAAAEAENERMEEEDGAEGERRAKLRQAHADEKEDKEAARADALKAKVAASDVDHVAAAKGGDTPEGDGEPPAEGEPLDLDSFVAKHDGELNKPAIVDWATDLSLDVDGTKVELLTLIHGALTQAGVVPE